MSSVNQPHKGKQEDENGLFFLNGKYHDSVTALPLPTESTARRTFMICHFY